MLTKAEVVPYLLHRGLLTAKSVVDGDLRVVDAARRNQNFKVLCSDATSYLIKQGSGSEAAHAIAHEAAVYRHAYARDADGPLREVMPRLYAYDHGDGVLVIELLREGKDLREYLLASRRFAPTLARRLGRTLAMLHTAVTPRPGLAPPAAEPPWILSMHRPRVDYLRHVSAGNLELIGELQRHAAFGEALDSLRADWRAESLVHNDVKWDNCVAFAPRGVRRTRVKLVDWEFAGWGDPAHDVGAVLGEYLNWWLYSIPVGTGVPPHELPRLAGFSLDAMHPAIRAFWEAYMAEAGLTGAGAAIRLVKSVRFCASRLLQTCYEHGQQSMALGGHHVLALQLGANVLAQPEEAVVQLLGLDWPGSSR